jgi:hypothetical protein
VPDQQNGMIGSLSTRRPSPDAYDTTILIAEAISHPSQTSAHVLHIRSDCALTFHLITSQRLKQRIDKEIGSGRKN